MTGIVLLLVVIAVFVFGARLTEIFLVSVRDGRVLPVRGRVPAALLTDVEDVVERANVRRATIRALRGLDQPRLVVRGSDVTPGLEQQLRNTFGIHPLAALRAAPRIEGPNLGQIIGWPWLAWVLARRRSRRHSPGRLRERIEAAASSGARKPRLRLLRGRTER